MGKYKRFYILFGAGLLLWLAGTGLVSCVDNAQVNTPKVRNEIIYTPTSSKMLLDYRRGKLYKQNGVCYAIERESSKRQIKRKNGEWARVSHINEGLHVFKNCNPYTLYEWAGDSNTRMSREEVSKKLGITLKEPGEE